MWSIEYLKDQKAEIRDYIESLYDAQDEAETDEEYNELERRIDEAEDELRGIEEQIDEQTSWVREAETGAWMRA